MALALAGILVIQDGGGTAIAFAGRTFASYGADVVEINPRHMPDTATATNERLRQYLAQGKRTLGMDLDDASARDLFVALTAGAGVVVTTRTLAEWDDIAPRPKVLVSLTPWGSDGPPAMRHAGDLLQYHGGGLGSITPRFANNPDEPPLRLGYPMAEFLTGLNASVSALAAFSEARESGESVAVDVSGQQAVAFAMGMYSAFPAYEGRAVSRVSRPELAPYHFLPCRDGWIMVICPEQHQWLGLVELMGSPEWARSELFGTSGGRAENWDAIEPFLVEWLRDWSTADIYRAAQARRIPLAPVSGPAVLLDSPQLSHRGFFADAIIGGQAVRVPGVPFAANPPLAAAPSGAPTPVSGGIAGASVDEIARLRAAGVVR